MKKTYSKPEIMYEAFSMNTSIASTCSLDAPAAYMSCAFNFPPYGNVFLSSIPDICTGKQITDNGGGDGQFDTICYHVPSAGNGLFNS